MLSIALRSGLTYLKVADVDLFMVEEDTYELLLSNYDPCLFNYSVFCYCVYYRDCLNVLCEMTYFYALEASCIYGLQGFE